MDRYNYQFDAYIQSKLKISENQTEKDFFLFNAEDPILINALEKTTIKAEKIPLATVPQTTGVYAKENHITIQRKNETTMINAGQFSLSGRHNLLNAMSASTIASLLEISKDSIRESLTHFKGAPHRMEKVLTIQHVQYINDSKATNGVAAAKALMAFDSIYWIAGGLAKDDGVGEAGNALGAVKKPI